MSASAATDTSRSNVDVQTLAERQARRESTRNRRADRKTAHERGNDGAGGRRRVSDVEGEKPCPADFVDEARDAGTRIGDEERSRRDTMGSAQNTCFSDPPPMARGQHLAATTMSSADTWRR